MLSPQRHVYPVAKGKTKVKEMAEITARLKDWDGGHKNVY